jgi:hypothetical protein
MEPLQWILCGAAVAFLVIYYTVYRPHAFHFFLCCAWATMNWNANRTGWTCSRCGRRYQDTPGM